MLANAQQVTSNVLVWAPAEKLGTRGLTEEDLSKSPGVECSERKGGKEVDVRGKTSRSPNSGVVG